MMYIHMDINDDLFIIFSFSMFPSFSLSIQNKKEAYNSIDKQI